MYEARFYPQGLMPAGSQAQGLAVQVSAESDGLHVGLPDGPAIWPYASLGLGFDRTRGGQLELSRGTQSVYVWHPDLIKRLKSELGPGQQQELATLLKQRRGAITGKLFKWTAISGVILAGAAVAGQWLLLKGRDAVVSQIPVSWEQSLGEQAYHQALSETPVCGGPILTKAMQQLEARLERGITGSPYELQFKVVKSEQVNAFALPGGYIAIHSALIAEAPSPESVLGVMAHESEHVLQRHGIKGVLNQLGITLVLPLLFGDTHSVMGAISRASGGLLGLGFDRGQESEADSKGLELLSQAKIDPHGMESFFRWMSEQEAEKGAPPEFLSTHPLSSNRLKQIQKTIASMPAATYPPIQIDWPAVQAAAKKCE